MQSQVTGELNKEYEDFTIHQELQILLGCLWENTVKIVPVIIGVLGTMPRSLRKHLHNLELEQITPIQLQKTILLGTARII